MALYNPFQVNDSKYNFKKKETFLKEAWTLENKQGFRGKGGVGMG